MVSLALLPIGYLLAGPLGESLGPRGARRGSVLATAALAAGTVVRGTWTYTSHPRAPAAAPERAVPTP